MEERFFDLPEALDNTTEISSKIIDLKLKKDILLPNFPLPAEYKTNQQYLEHLTWEGAKRRFGDINDEARERLNSELGIIEKTGFAGYFLIVQDFINAARELGVWVGPGRGSAAGSAVAYCIGITNIDPLKYNLLFERFLNPERISMPDMDIDFDDVGRQKVIDYVVEKYGKNQVAQIITFGTMGPKTGIRDVARVLGLPLAESNRIAKLIPETPGMTFERAFAEVKELAELRKSPDALVRKTIRIAETLEGCTRHHGIHAAGVIIAPNDIREHIPVLPAKDSDFLVTQYEGKLVEDVGLLKMDFLGLKTLSILKDALENIKTNHDIDIDLDQIPLDDQKTFELFQRADTLGIFQFESAGMRKYLRDLKPTHIEDLIAMNALFRPGPMNNIPEFIARKHGKKISYPHPLLENILKPTYGIMVYQEQIMQVAQLLAGYTLGSADLLRRAMGKKKIEEMQNHRAIFVEGALQRNIEEKTAHEIFSTMEKFAEYGFNRSHSAGYALIAYQTAYLKANYAPEFMAATLSNSMASTDDTQYYLSEAKRLKIKTLGPDINESDVKFVAKKNGEIRFSLSAIKGIGDAAVSAVVQERKENGSFKNIFDLSKRVGSRALKKNALESLAASGAFDCFEGTHRAQYFASMKGETTTVIEKAMKFSSSEQNKSSSMNSLFADSNEVIATPQLPVVEEWSSLIKLKREKDVTGIYLSGHPLEDFKLEMKSFCNATTTNLEENKNKDASVAGIISTSEQRMTRTGRAFGSFTLEDFEGTAEMTLFGEDYLKFKHFLVPGTLLLIKGRYQLRWNSEDQYELKITSMQLLQEVREKLTKKITLSVSVNGISEKVITEVENIFKKHKGNYPVMIQVNDELENISLHFNAAKNNVNLSDQFISAIGLLSEVEIKLN